MQQNKSVGTPPILVLSYKNHAADEFLSDLLKVTGTVLTGNTPLSNLYPGQNVQMVRMGNSGDPNLTQVRRVVIMHDSTMVYIRSQIDVHVCVQMRSIQRKILPNNAVIRTCRQNRVRELQDLRRACQRAARSATLFQSYQADTPFSEPWPPRGFSPSFFFKPRAS